MLDSALQLGHGRGLRMRGLLPKPMGVEQLVDMLMEFRRPPRELFAGDLAEAIASNQLFLEYQPKFDCDLRQLKLSSGGATPITASSSRAHSSRSPRQAI